MLGLGKDPEVADSVEEEARERRFKLAEAFASGSTRLAVGTMVGVIGNCEDLHQGLQQGGGGSVKWGVEGAIESGGRRIWS